RKGSPFLIERDETDGDQNGSQPERAHPCPDILRLAASVGKDLYYATDLPAFGITNQVTEVLFSRFLPIAWCSIV
ncbi:MAG: hypothetical protein M3N45_06005, partial [Actinomycetota bacterium]|nr:hypothetical protein [Actinomycetota bacterium]